MIFFGNKKKKSERVKRLTDFGKVLANIRIINEESLRAQAKKLGICASLLCAYSYRDRNVSEKIAPKLFKSYLSLNEYSCEIIMAEIYGNEILQRLASRNPEMTKKELLEFEIFVICGVDYKIA